MFENIELSPNEYFEKVEELKNDGFEMMVDLTAIDWFRKKEPRFEIVVNFLSVSKNKRVCLVVKVNDDLKIKLINAWISVDAGEVAYEDGIKAQVEGGFIQAASWSLYEEVKFDTKEIISKDWDTYKIIEFDNIPNIKTSVIDKEGMPYLGVGEVVAGPTGAAISNAISEALGQTIKTMPFTKEIITRELLEN